MRLDGPARRLTVIVGESDHWHHRPVYQEIVHRAHAAGLAGATVLKGVESYGAGGLVHTARLLSLSEDMSMVIIIIDEPARIDAFLPQLDDLVTGGVAVVEDVSVIRYVSDSGTGPQDHDS